MKNSTKLLLVAQTALLLSACHSSVKTDQTKLAQVQIKNGEYSPEVASPEASEAGTQVDFDMAAEGEISKQALQAWRKALKGDEKGAISQLNALEERYPKYSTIKFMKGQVYEHLGKKEEAIKYYRESLDNSQFSSIRQFKLAGVLRKDKKFKESEAIYRKLLKTFSDFPDAKLGLAQCLIAQDPNSKEGHQLVGETVTLCKALLQTQEPDKVKEATRNLKEILELEPSNEGAKELLHTK